MKKATLVSVFGQYQVGKEALRKVVGGLCACKQAASYACENSGSAGSSAFYRCLREVYSGCEELHAAACAQQ